MITLCIKYKLDIHKLAHFEEYAKSWPVPIERCGGKLTGYFLPTKLAGPTDAALALIDFPNLAAYEQYRERLLTDPDAVANVVRADASGCILVEDRSFLQQAGSTVDAPVTMDELQQLESTAGWTAEDADCLRDAAKSLVPQAEGMVDDWRATIARQPHLLASFLKPDGHPDDAYRAAIKVRFVQWVSDICLQPHDRDWLDYQEQIGLRHTPAAKNRTDGGHTPSVVPLRYLIAFSAVVTGSLRPYLADIGDEELQRIQTAWNKAVLLSIALWARPYTSLGLW